jgi:hypothetical protein
LAIDIISIHSRDFRLEFTPQPNEEILKRIIYYPMLKKQILLSVMYGVGIIFYRELIQSIPIPPIIKEMVILVHIEGIWSRLKTIIR